MNNQTIKIRNMQTINNITEQTGRSPYIGENGNWFEFNDETQAFVDSGVVAQGIPGEEGKQGEPGVQGENGKDALINGVNILTLLAGENIEFKQDGDTLKINAKGGDDDGVYKIKYLESDTTNKIYLWDLEPGIYFLKGTFYYHTKHSKNITFNNVLYFSDVLGAKSAYLSTTSGSPTWGDSNKTNWDMGSDGFCKFNTVTLYGTINTLTYTTTGRPLDATQGKILKGYIDDINEKLGDIDTILSTLTTVEEVSE